MKDNRKNLRLRRLRSTFEHSKLARWTCIVFPSVMILSLIWTRSQQYTYNLTTEEERCWLTNAFLDDKFMVGSHRSLGDSQFAKQPTCLEGLMQLNLHGVHYLDLDLIWDPDTQQLVVAHPMEFQRTTEVFSPCANTPLSEVLRLIKTAMPKWFVSLEPKADWDRTKEFPLLKEPVLLLHETLKVMEESNLKPDQCTIFVDANKVGRKEDFFLDKLADYCSLSLAIRRYEGHDAQMAIEKKHYEYIMPTIEFHPTHHNYQSTTGVDSLEVVQRAVPKSVYWIVDTPQDLERVALFKGTGLVSNRPLEITKILGSHGWCPVPPRKQRLGKKPKGFH